MNTMLERPNGLSQRQELFIEGILRGKTQVHAYWDAGYAKTANRHADEAAASLLVGKLRIEIERRRLPMVRKLNLSLQDTILETERMAYFDPGEVMSWDQDEGLRVVSSKDLSPEQRRMVKSVTTSVTETISPTGARIRTTKTKLEMIDRQRALERLGDYQGLGSGAVNLPALIDPESQSTAEEELERIRAMPTAVLLAEIAKLKGKVITSAPVKP